MSKELKAIVLAKCGEIEQGLQDNGWTVIRSPIKEVAQYYFEDESESNFITIDDTLSAYSWQWAATAKILGIQDSQAEADKECVKRNLGQVINGEYDWVKIREHDDLFKAISRLAGMKIENSSNALEHGKMDEDESPTFENGSK